MTLERKIAFYKNHKELLSPILQLQGKEDLDKNMVRVVGQGVELLESERLLANAIESPQTTALWLESLPWVEKIVKEEWLPDNLADRMLAVKDAVGEDAFLSAWALEQERCQLIITKQRLHLLVTDTAKGSPTDRKHYAFYCAERYLALRQAWNESSEIPWSFRDFGGNLLSYRDYPFYLYWDQSLLLLSDGKGVKCSILKVEDETSPPQRTSMGQQIDPWFEPVMTDQEVPQN